MSTQAANTPGESFFRGQLLARRQRLESALTQPAGHEYLAGLLDEVDAALDRLSDGTFGVCESCHDPIERDRLVSDPLIRLCLDHLNEAQRRALEQDLSVSANIQVALLPKNNLRLAGWEIAYHYEPAGIVSGDYCDVVPGGDQFLFVLGDVSGKGVPASILMAHLHAMFRSLNMMELPLDQLLRQANRMFCESTLPSFYATVVCGRASRSGSIEMANAGHCPPLVAHSGKLETAEPTGLPLGLFCNAQYGVHKFDLRGGDRLLLYTDGLSEARNSADEEYGAERVSGLLKQDGVASAHELAAACARDVRGFLGSRPAHDDVTVLAMRRE